MLCDVTLPNTLPSVVWVFGFYCCCGVMASAVEDAVNQATEGLGGGGVAEKLEQHAEAFTGFLGDVQANVISQLNAQSVGPEGFVENFQGD